MTIKIQSLGHSCFLFESHKGVRLLVDPFITGNKDAAVSIKDIGRVDLVTVSYGAFDHLGDAIPICKQTGAKLFCSADVAYYAFNQGMDEENVLQFVNGTGTYRGLEIRATKAKRISFFPCIAGYPMSFIFRMEDGTGIYFSGDSSINCDLKLTGKSYSVQIGLFCVGGLPMEMSALEAALVAQWLGVKVAIPMHYPQGTNYPEEFSGALSGVSPKVNTVILKPGESYCFE